jgi:TetR/AcrR family transcriptional regulator
MGEERDRRQEILEAAFAEFAAKGFRGATIKSIAEAAGVQSPALLYWYFPNKEALFQATLLERAPILRAVTTALPQLDRPPEEVLPLIGRSYLAMAVDEQERRFFRLLIMEVVQRPEIARSMAEEGPGRVLGFLTSYLARQIELGRLRPHDVRVSARAFVGMFIPPLVLGILSPALAAAGATHEEHLRTAVEIFLRGLRPDAG